jgi:hypothetical protein
MDIIGFNDQIGVSFPKIALSKFKKPMAPIVKKTITPMFKKPMAPIVKKTITPMAKAIDKIKLNTALLQAKQTGKPVIVKTPSRAIKFAPKTATPFKGLMPKATPFNLVPTASKSFKPIFRAATVQKNVPVVKNEVRQMEQSLQNLPAAKQAQAIFSLAPTPVIVQELTPVQRSFLKTDLPYKIISKNNFGQPTTKFLKNTPLKFNIDIDQIVPSVDAGINDYYGK